MEKKKNYIALAESIQAGANCAASGNEEWLERWTGRIERIMETAPSGSGFDSGTEIDVSKCTDERLVFTTSYHHMNENGMYDGWTDHTITVKANLLFGFTVSVSGRNRNDIKEYIAEVFNDWLSMEEESTIS